MATRRLELVRRFNVARGGTGSARLGISNLLPPASDTDSGGLGLVCCKAVLTAHQVRPTRQELLALAAQIDQLEAVYLLDSTH